MDHHKNRPKNSLDINKENLMLNGTFSSLISQRLENRNKTKEEILTLNYYGIVLKFTVFQAMIENMEANFSQNKS